MCWRFEFSRRYLAMSRLIALFSKRAIMSRSNALFSKRQRNSFLAAAAPAGSVLRPLFSLHAVAIAATACNVIAWCYDCLR